jgi:hypothetical protein
MKNKILDELHAARAKLLEDAGGDLNRYIREADERLKASGREPRDRAVNQYPRQGFTDRSVAREKFLFSKLTSLNPTLFQRRLSPLAADR